MQVRNINYSTSANSDANSSEVTKHLDVETHRDTVSDRKSHPSATRCYPSTI